MRLLLDECVPRRLKNDFVDHEARTVVEAGLTGFLDGALLRAAVAQQFDVLITVDRQMPFQQNLTQFRLALIILVAKPCRYAELKLLIPAALTVLATIQAGDVVTIE